MNEQENVNVCWKRRLDALDKRRALIKEIKETLLGIGLVVVFILLLGIEGWVEALI